MNNPSLRRAAISRQRELTPLQPKRSFFNSQQDRNQQDKPTGVLVANVPGTSNISPIGGEATIISNNHLNSNTSYSIQESLKPITTLNNRVKPQSASQPYRETKSTSFKDTTTTTTKNNEEKQQQKQEEFFRQTNQNMAYSNLQMNVANDSIFFPQSYRSNSASAAKNKWGQRKLSQVQSGRSVNKNQSLNESALVSQAQQQSNLVSAVKQTNFNADFENSSGNSFIIRNSSTASSTTRSNNATSVSVSRQITSTPAAIIIKNSFIGTTQQNFFPGYSNLQLSNFQNDDTKTYKFCIGRGNNSQLIRQIMACKPRWSEIPLSSLGQQFDSVNFLWQPVSGSIPFDRVKSSFASRLCVNHVERHYELSSKSRLVKNLTRICSRDLASQQLHVFDITPLTFCVDYNRDNLNFERQFEAFLSSFLSHTPTTKSFAIESEAATILRAKNYHAGFSRNLSTARPYQLLLHSRPNHSIHATAAAASTSISIQRNIAGSQSAKASQVMQQQQHHAAAVSHLQQQLFTGLNIWIIKPADFNRGRGIRIFSSLNQLNKILQEYAEAAKAKHAKQLRTKPGNISSSLTHSTMTSNLISSSMGGMMMLSGSSNSSCIGSIGIAAGNTKSMNSNSSNNSNNNTSFELNSSYVIQKYIERPLLIEKRKFDIRMWVLLSAFEGKYYVCREGYIRTACEAYSTSESSISNTVVHLTNNAIQKNATGYGKHEEGNQLSFHAFEEYNRRENVSCDFRGVVLPKIKEAIALSIDAVKSKVNPLDRRHCFEILGYDFMIDSASNPWLIEVSTNPCIEQSSQMLDRLLKRMLDDAFKLTVDKLFPQSGLGAASFKSQLQQQLLLTQSLSQSSQQQQAEAARYTSIYPVDHVSNTESIWEQLQLGNYPLLRAQFDQQVSQQHQ